MNVHCREVNSVANEASKLKPELDAKIRQAAQKAGQSYSGKQQQYSNVGNQTNNEER